MIKAVIPVAGAGTMLRPHTHTQPKALIPVAGQPILGHIIDSISAAGIRDFVFIIGYLGEKIEGYVRDVWGDRINASFVVQAPREGLGHALWVARAEIASADEVLILLGDTILDVNLKEVIANPVSTLGVQVVEDPGKFGVAVTDDDGHVESVAEKPRIPKSNLALVGLYKIREVKDLNAALEKLIAEKKSSRGEYHLTDAIMTMISGGNKFRTHLVDTWFDCGKKETLLETNKILLERMADRLPHYRFPNTVIHHPVHIGPNCKISDSIIGPYVAVGENATISRSVVTQSILGTYSTLESIILENSVIGSDATLRGKSNSVNIGDNTEIDFND